MTLEVAAWPARTELSPAARAAGEVRQAILEGSDVVGLIGESHGSFEIWRSCRCLGRAGEWRDWDNASAVNGWIAGARRYHLLSALGLGIGAALLVGAMEEATQHSPRDLSKYMTLRLFHGLNPVGASACWRQCLR